MSRRVGKSKACTVCESKFRHIIEVGLANGMSGAALAAKYAVSKDAIHRHSKNHLTPVMRAAILTAQAPSAVDLETLRTTETEGLLGHLVAQRARLEKQNEIALEAQDVRAAVAVEGAITSNLTLVAKLMGQLVQVHDVRHSSILISPDYLALRTKLFEALRPFPDAMRAVGAALHTMESDAAKDITSKVAKPKPAPMLIEHDDCEDGVLPPPY